MNVGTWQNENIFIEINYKNGEILLFMMLKDF